MKRITIIFKTILFAAVVFVMAQGCIPNIPVGGTPSPTAPPNGYDSSSSSQCYPINRMTIIKNYDQTPDSLVQSVLILGDDTLYFDLYSQFNRHISYGRSDNIFQYFAIFSQTNDSSFEFLTYSDAFVSSTPVLANLIANRHWSSQLPALLEAGVTIGNTLPANFKWDKQPWYPMDEVLPRTVVAYGADSTYTENTNNTITAIKYDFYNFPINEDRYVVFRTLKNNIFKYYSVKIKRYGNPTLSVGCILAMHYICYNFNSITTGQ